MKGSNGGLRGLPFARPYVYRAGLSAGEAAQMEAARVRLDNLARYGDTAMVPVWRPAPARRTSQSISSLPPEPAPSPDRCESSGYLMTAPGHLMACGEVRR